MGILSNLKKNKEKKENISLLKNTIYDLIIYTIIFLIIFVILRFFLKAIFNLNDTSKIIVNYKDAVTYTVNNTIYIAIVSVIMSIGSFLIFMGTIFSSFKRKLINKDNYKMYTWFMAVVILIMTTLAGVLIMRISYESLLCIGKVCKITDLSFYNYELEIYNRLYIGLVLNYSIWTFITILICGFTIKYLHNKRIVIKETSDKKPLLSKLFKKHKKK